MKKFFLILLVLILYLPATALSRQMDESVFYRLTTVRHYPLHNIPFIYDSYPNNENTGEYHTIFILINLFRYDIFDNDVKAVITAHEYFHEFSINEGLVQAVAADEIKLWYREPYSYTSGIYDKEVAWIRKYSSIMCKCKWTSQTARRLRKSWLIVNAL